MIRFCYILILAWVLEGPSVAQSLSKKADRQFDQLADASAIELYEQALIKPGTLSEAEQRDAKAKPGYSYQQMRDMPNAGKGELVLLHKHLALKRQMSCT